MLGGNYILLGYTVHHLIIYHVKIPVRKLVPLFCSPLGKCKIETENTFTRAIICHVWKADTAVSGGKKKKGREKGESL